MSDFSYVFLGNAANDGTGTPLRTAFQIIDENFANIAAGNANVIINSPVNSVAGRTGNVVLTVNDVAGAANVAYVDAAVTAGNAYVESIAANIANSNLAALTSQVSTLDANVGNITVEITAINSNLATQTSDISTINSTLSTYTTEIASTNSNLANLYTELNNTINNVNGAVNNITTLFANASVQETEIASLGANISAANVAIQTVDTAWQSNAAVQYQQIQDNTLLIQQVSANVAGANTSIISANIGMLAHVEDLNQQMAANVAAANLAIVTANTAVVSYVNTEISAVDDNIVVLNNDITALNNNIVSANSYAYSIDVAWHANAAVLYTDIQTNNANELALGNLIANVSANVTAANVYATGYADTLNLAMTANVTAANLAIVTANTAVVSYVNTQLAVIDSNLANVASEINSINANVAAANLHIANNSSTITQIDSTVANILTTLTVGPISVLGNITSGNISANSAVYATTGFFWSNGAQYITSVSPTGNITFSGDTISSVDNTGGINLNANGKIHMQSLTGFDSSNPGYWVDIGNLQYYNTGNLGINFSNGSGYSNTAVITYDWWDGTSMGQTNNSSVKHSTIGLYRGDGVPGTGQTRAYITFDTESAGAQPAIEVLANSAAVVANIITTDLTAYGNINYTMGNYQNWTSNVYTISSALDQLAQRLKAAGF